MGRHLLFLLPAIVAISVASYFLYREQNPEKFGATSRGNMEIVGTISFSDRNVKRQQSEELVWNSISKDMPIFNKDSLRTGKDSGAILKLNDNSIIELGENSLIVIDKSSQDLSVDFKAGDITTKNASEKLTLKVAQNTIQAAGSELKIKSDAQNKARIEVAKGRALLTDRNKKTSILEQANLAGVDETGVNQIQELSVNLLTPEDKTEIDTTNTSFKQVFTWEVTKPQINSETLEISIDKKFKTLLHSYKGHQAATAELPPGTYYWRIGWLSNGKTLYTEFRKLNIGLDKRLELIYPEDQSVFNLNTDENQLDFQWKSKVKAKTFLMEVALSPDFKRMVKSVPTIELTHRLSGLDPQTYYWRVKAYDEKNKEIASSRGFSFKLKVKLPQFPELVKPTEDAIVPSKNFVDLEWKPYAVADSYRLVISKDEGQKEIVGTFNLKENVHQWKTREKGRYFWSVKALNKDKQIFAESHVREFKLSERKITPAFQIIKPIDKAVIVRAAAENPEPIIFQWQLLREIPGPVQIVFSQNEDFSDAKIAKDVPKLSHSLRFSKPGVYFWKLRSENASKDEKVESEPTSFRLKVSKVFNPTKLIEPADKAHVEGEGQTAVKFSWEPVVGASQYHIVVERDQGRQKEAIPMVDRIVKEATFTSQPIAEGNYIWNVSTVDEEGQEGVPSQTFGFKIAPPELAPAPELNEPVIK